MAKIKNFINKIEEKETTLAEDTRVKAVKVKDTNVLSLTKDNYGPFYEFVIDDEITDVDFNGKQLWITHTDNRREEILDHGITRDFVQRFSQRVANKVSKPFNKINPLLEAETEILRISILHEAAAISGRSICLRKTPIKARMTTKSILQDNYMNKDMMSLLVNCVLAHMNFCIIGEPGAGKTELAKYISKFIPLNERVITIEDSPEWHYSKLNPDHDCVEMRINPDFDYAKAIKTCLRQNPKWIMLSEARSTEAKYLIESWSTGVNGITTLHCDDIRKIPSRFLNMMGNSDDSDRLKNDVYEFCNVVMLVRRKKMPDGTARRYVDQMGFLDKETLERTGVGVIPIVKSGELLNNAAGIIPREIITKLNRIGVQNFFYSPIIEDELAAPDSVDDYSYDDNYYDDQDNDEQYDDYDSEYDNSYDDQYEEDYADTQQNYDYDMFEDNRNRQTYNNDDEYYDDEQYETYDNSNEPYDEYDDDYDGDYDDNYENADNSNYSSDNY